MRIFYEDFMKDCRPTQRGAIRISCQRQRVRFWYTGASIWMARRPLQHQPYPPTKCVERNPNPNPTLCVAGVVEGRWAGRWGGRCGAGCATDEGGRAGGKE